MARRFWPRRRSRHVTTSARPPITIPDVMWSVGSSLCSEVLPQLRVVTAAIRDGLRLRFVCDYPVDEDLRDISIAVEGYVTSYLNVEVSSVTETQMEGPIALSLEEVLAYHRREPEPLIMTATSVHPEARLEYLEDHEPSDVHRVRRALGLLAVRAALLSEVTPDLRVVIIDPTDGVGVRMIYDRPVDAEIEATAARVHAATKAGLHIDETVTTRAECVPEGRVPGPEGQVTAYMRNEDEWMSHLQRPSRYREH